MKKVLLSAFSCNPYKGSESSSGWNWAIGLANRGFEVHVFTRTTNKSDILHFGNIENLIFHFVSLPFGLEKLYTSFQPAMYLYYMLWQWKTLKLAKKLHKCINFNLAHHVSWGSIQQGTFLYKLKIPLLFGPTGGGQKAPLTLKKYFGERKWKSEIRRERVSYLFLNYNPAYKNMLRNAKVIIVANKETAELVEKINRNNIHFSLDAALAKDFYPKNFIQRTPAIANLRLLWVGRMMPRKGLSLVLEVMKELKGYSGIKLTIVGDGEMRSEAEKMVQEWDIKSSVFFTGAIPFEKVREHYNKNDIFFFTSLRDSGPAQLVEAFSFGLPIVTIAVNGQDQIVDSSRGIKVKVDSPLLVKELGEAILRIGGDSELYNTLSRNAFEYAQLQTWDNKIDEIVSKYY
ncbi:glycosyltransferase family 4 protein, partial [Gillisia sp. CAL575]|uniref:glycosyltransferase family 4 protein n=1 Tax=Gillisia sp. CAL575 TaxID=985255 RepID=UPI00039E1714